MEAATQPAIGNGTPPEPPEEPMEGEAAEEQARPEIAVEGDGQLSLKIGGRKPDKATVKLRGGSINVPRGQYEKGDQVNLLIGVRCAEVHLVDKIDGTTGEVTETERRQIFKVTRVERV